MEKILGISIITFSTILYAAIGPLLKKASDKVPPFALIAVSMAVLFMLSFVSNILFEHGSVLKLETYKEHLPYIILAGIINFIGFWLAILGYKYMPLWQQTLFQLLTPICAGIFAYLLLGEALSPKLFLGLAIMSIGLFIAVR